MANKPKHLKPTDQSVRTAENLINAGKAMVQAELDKLKEYAAAAPLDHQAIGELRMLNHQMAYSGMLRLMILYRIKQSKDYKKGGMTWEQFCDAVGEKDRTLDRLIAEIKPVYEAVSASLATFAGVNPHKIKYLGKAVSAKLAEINDGYLVYRDEKIPLTPEHHEEVQALIEQIETDYKTKLEETEATLRANKKIVKQKDDLLVKQEKDLRKFEKRAEGLGLSPEEDAFEQQMENFRLGFDGYMSRIEPTRIEELQTFAAPRGEDGLHPSTSVTPRMRAAYITSLTYMLKQVRAAHDTAVEMFGADLEEPDEGWRPK